jgi:hypothetical protein
MDDKVIVVLGAGLSGLEAAWSVISRTSAPDGLRIVLLEARHRVGGRVQPLPLPDSREWVDSSNPARPTAAGEGPVIMDAGAAWVHGVDGNPVTAPRPQGYGAIVREAHDCNPWMFPMHVKPGASAARDGIKPGPLLVAMTENADDVAPAKHSAELVSGIDLDLIRSSHAETIGSMRDDGLRASTHEDFETSVQAELDALLSRRDSELVRNGLRWSMWGAACWMGATLSCLQLAEMANTTALWGDLPGAHGPVEAIEPLESGLADDDDDEDDLCGLFVVMPGSSTPQPIRKVVGAHGFTWLAAEPEHRPAEGQEVDEHMLCGSSLIIGGRLETLAVAAKEKRCRIEIWLNARCTSISAVDGAGAPLSHGDIEVDKPRLFGGETASLSLLTGPVGDVDESVISTFEAHFDAAAKVLPPPEGLSLSAEPRPIEDMAVSQPASPLGQSSIRLSLQVTRAGEEAEEMRFSTTNLITTLPAAILQASFPVGEREDSDRDPSVVAEGGRQMQPVRAFPNTLVPDWKRKAIAATRTGSYLKIAMRWGRSARWWPKDAPAVWGVLGEADDSSSGLPKVHYIENYSAIKGPDHALQSCLVAVLVGDDAGKVFAADAEGASDSRGTRAMVKAAFEAVSKVAAAAFGVTPEPPSSWGVVNWDSDPLAGGAYSYYGIGVDGDALDHLATAYSVKRASSGPFPSSSKCTIAWAGEAACPEWLGSLHGAIHAGRLAGQSIAQAISH